MFKLLMKLGMICIILSLPLDVAANDHVKTPHIVGFKSTIIVDIIEAYEGEVVTQLASINALVANLTEKDARDLANHEQIAYVEKDEVIQMQQQKVSMGIEKTKAPNAWRSNFTGSGIKIAVLDSGVARNHPDIPIKKGISFVPYTSHFNDDNGHGTQVAGIIAARNNQIGTVGMAPNADIYVVKVLDRRGNGYQSNVIKGIEWALNENVDIINLSVGSTEYSRALELILKKADEEGILIIAAAGNDGKEVQFPASFSSVIAVAATDSLDRRASFSATGNEVELSAPGVNVYSTHVNGSYTYVSGTSMAAPHVTGHAALLIEANPQLNHHQIRALLQEQTIDLGQTGRDPLYGYGRIQLQETMRENNPGRLFIDLNPTKWYTTQLIDLYNKGIIQGYHNNTMKPNQAITRAEAMTMISRALNFEEVSYKNSFRDVNSTHFAANTIQTAYERNVVNGYVDGTFRPNAFVTRGEMAELLIRAFEMDKIDIGNTFHDVDESYFAIQSINTLSYVHVVTGYPNGTFRPNNHTSRAEFAVLLDRIMK